MRRRGDADDAEMRDADDGDRRGGSSGRGRGPRYGGAPEREEGEEVGADAQADVVKSFDSRRLKDELLRGVYSYGF